MMVGNPLLILFVDDDPDDFELFREALTSLNAKATCLHVLDGKEAIDLLSDEIMTLPDYIVMDVNMPRMGGKECLVKIKKTRRLENIPVIFYSTTSNPDEIERCKELGAKNFIVKPGRFKELVAVLSQVMV
jgi:CheY-like chemotaxis protein